MRSVCEFCSLFDQDDGQQIGSYELWPCQTIRLLDSEAEAWRQVAELRGALESQSYNDDCYDCDENLFEASRVLARVPVEPTSAGKEQADAG